MQKKRIIAITDIVLAVSMLGLFISGNHLHLTMKYDIVDSWHRSIHIIFAVLFTISTLFHFLHHIGWFKLLLTKPLGHKKLINIALTVVMIFEIVSGIVVFLYAETAHLAVVHHKIGIIAMILAFLHFAKRHEIIGKMLKH